MVLVPCLPESGTTEAKNALARAVFLNRLGEIRDRSYEDQRYRASGLNLLVTAIILRLREHRCEILRYRIVRIIMSDKYLIFCA